MIYDETHGVIYEIIYGVIMRKFRASMLTLSRNTGVKTLFMLNLSRNIGVET